MSSRGCASSGRSALTAHLPREVPFLSAARGGGTRAGIEAISALGVWAPGRSAADAVSWFDQRTLDRRGVETLDQLQFQVPSWVSASEGRQLALRGVGGDPATAELGDRIARGASALWAAAAARLAGDAAPGAT